MKLILALAHLAIGGFFVLWMIDMIRAAAPMPILP